MTPSRLIKALLLFMALAPAPASAQDKGSLAPRALPPLAKPDDPATPAKDLFGRKGIDGVSLRVGAGRTLGVVGESGCGKSTLGRLMTRLLDPTEGRLLVNGADVTTLEGDALRAVRATVQMVFQDPFSSLNPRQTVGTILSTPLRFLSDDTDRDARVRELMAQVGLNPEHVNRYPHEFSGGQRQRVGIARALASRPKVIVADEPVSALDVSIQAQVLNLFEQLQADLGLAYVFIAHDLAVVRRVAADVAVMYLGRVVEQGPAQAVLDTPRHPYTVALKSAVPITDPADRGRRHRIILEGDVPSAVNPPSGCRFRTRCPIAQQVCAESDPALVDRGDGWAVACHFPGGLATAG